MKKTIFCFLFAILNISLHASDWTKWRGEHADGTTQETDWNAEALKNPNILWQTNVGMGHSAVAVKGDKLYTMGNHQLAENQYEDIVHCLDAKTGREIWKYAYTCQEGEDPGPGSTPVIDGDNLYTLSREGHLFCFDANNGKIQWKRQLLEEGLVNKHEWGFSSSPVIYENRLLLSINKSGIALDKRTGKLLWNSELDKCGFSTPVLFRHRDHVLAAILHDRKLNAVEPETGKIVWSYPMGWGDADPVPYDDKLLITGQATQLLDLSEKNPKEIWKNKELQWQFQSVAIVNNYAYGFGKIDWDRKIQNFYCVDLESGTLKWNKEFEMWGASIAVGNHIILITGQGKLIIIKASPENFLEMSSAQLIKMKPHDTTKGHRRECHCWTCPVLSNGRLFVRNTYGELVCVNLSK